MNANAETKNYGEHVSIKCNLGLSWLPKNFKVHTSFDSQHWAAQFLQTIRENPEITVDHDLMVCWFANALMKGYDEHRFSTREYKLSVSQALFPWWSWKRYLPYKTGRLATAVLIFLLCMIPTGCPTQNQTAALVGIAGTAIATLETIEGHTDAAAKIQTDFAALRTAVLNFKPGTPSQDAAQACQIVIDDINLLPVSDKDRAYIEFAAGTIQSILDAFPSTGIQAHKVTARLANPPKNASEFRALWNALPGNLAPIR